MTEAKKPPPFIKLPYSVYDSPEFATLLPIDIAVLLVLIRKHNGHNNGRISLGLKEIARRCNCSKGTAVNALVRLQKAKFIERTEKGHSVPKVGTPDIASRWRICFAAQTEEISDA